MFLSRDEEGAAENNCNCVVLIENIITTDQNDVLDQYNILGLLMTVICSGYLQYPWVTVILEVEC